MPLSFPSDMKHILKPIWHEANLSWSQCGMKPTSLEANLVWSHADASLSWSQSDMKPEANLSLVQWLMSSVSGFQYISFCCGVIGANAACSLPWFFWIFQQNLCNYCHITTFVNRLASYRSVIKRNSITNLLPYWKTCARRIRRRVSLVSRHPEVTVCWGIFLRTVNDKRDSAKLIRALITSFYCDTAWRR